MSLKQQLLRTMAAKLLSPAKKICFSRIALGRQSYLLSLVLRVNKRYEPKLAAFRELDYVSLLICSRSCSKVGICPSHVTLNQRKLSHTSSRRMPVRMSCI